MSKNCYICNTEMEQKQTSINTGWGQYKLTVEGVSAYVCPKCGEVVSKGRILPSPVASSDFNHSSV